MCAAVWPARRAPLSHARLLLLCHTSALQRLHTQQERAHTPGESTGSTPGEHTRVCCTLLTRAYCCCCAAAADVTGNRQPCRRQPSVRTTQTRSVVACLRFAPAEVLEAGPHSHMLSCLCALRCACVRNSASALAAATGRPSASSLATRHAATAALRRSSAKSRMCPPLLQAHLPRPSHPRRCPCSAVRRAASTS